MKRMVSLVLVVLLLAAVLPADSYAVSQDAASWKITWNANGGKIGSVKKMTNKVKQGAKIGKKIPVKPVKTGFKFMGWYTKKAGGVKVTKTTKPVKNTTYYARWKPANVAPVGLYIGQQAPDFTLPSRGGKNVTLSGLRGKPVILNFWATWCPPCRSEMPDFQRIYAEYGGRLHMLGVNLGEDPGTVDRFLGKVYTFPVAYDMNYTAWSLYSKRSNGIPQTWIIDSMGVIVEYILGSTSYSWLKRTLDTKLAGEL